MASLQGARSLHSKAVVCGGRRACSHLAGRQAASRTDREYDRGSRSIARSALCYASTSRTAVSSRRAVHSFSELYGSTRGADARSRSLALRRALS